MSNEHYLIVSYVLVGFVSLQRTGEWVVCAVFLWCIVVVICLIALRSTQPNGHHKLWVGDLLLAFCAHNFEFSYSVCRTVK